jgi:hypothetical protein
MVKAVFIHKGFPVVHGRGVDDGVTLPCSAFIYLPGIFVPDNM